MIGIGIAGLGFMGMIHYLAAGRVGGLQVVALCSRDPEKRAGNWSSIRGNFGPRGGQVDLSDKHVYERFEDLLADPSVDLVDLCVPNDEHAPMAVRALEAGKHVLVEKPIALTTEDADRMLDAARGSNRLLMVAHVLPFFPEFHQAREIVAQKTHGGVQAVHLHRLISRPDWSSQIGDARRTGGPVIDLHIHDTHFLALLCGMPKSVSSVGVERGGEVVHLGTHYQFAGGSPVATAVSGALCQSGRPFSHGFEIYLEEATLAYSSSTLRDQTHVSVPFSIYRPEGRIENPELGSSDPIDAFAAELDAVKTSIQSGIVARPLDPEVARQALVLCQAEAQSVLTGSPVEVG